MDTPTDDEPPSWPRRLTPEERDAKLARMMKEQNIQPGGWSDMPVECGDESTTADDEPRPKPRTLTPEERDALVARLKKEQNIRPDAWERLDGACLHLFKSEAELEAFYAHLERTRTEEE